MGIKVVFMYVLFVMGYFEEKFYSILLDIFDVDFMLYIKENWKRYFDDCFIFWIKMEEDFIKFYFILNELQVLIKFIIDVYCEKFLFLDIFIIKDGENIIIDLFSKEIDFY